MAKLNVVLLFGGKSSEHSISCATAAGVLGAIDRSKYHVIPVGITRQGVFVPAEDNAERWALRKGELAVVQDEGARVEFSMDGSRQIYRIGIDGSRSSLGAVDIVFPVLHGPFGEDGTIQGFLELAGIPYVGNGVLASAAGMDKEFTKAIFQDANIPVTPHVVIREANWMRDPESSLEAVRNLGLPVFVKPARAGSSVGVSKVKNWDDFAPAVALALEHDNKLVVEHGLVGREVECAVLSGRDGARPRVSVAGEIVVTGRDFYDFDAKYQDEDSVDLIIPAAMTEDQLTEMQSIARRAFEALGCQGLGRVDFFLTADGFFVNEINTMPGFTPLSMFPSLWQASGIAYSDLIDELINLGLNAKH
ncbi:D-alanine--D-alanine ligase family protein [Rhodoluna limnophila]|uniref:D-alanine--D-alanine ligase family protein n=1 Tax=Rhodoluna limnophila TaxID=232537 RepID=UPI001106E702|nr:D-alanine--D-alanine ligase family protein [Rhodoluna limnophila]